MCYWGGLEAFIAVGLHRVDEPSGGGDGPRAKTFELAARSSGLEPGLQTTFTVATGMCFDELTDRALWFDSLP